MKYLVQQEKTFLNWQNSLQNYLSFDGWNTFTFIIFEANGGPKSRRSKPIKAEESIKIEINVKILSNQSKTDLKINETKRVSRKIKQQQYKQNESKWMYNDNFNSYINIYGKHEIWDEIQQIY